MTTTTMASRRDTPPSLRDRMDLILSLPLPVPLPPSTPYSTPLSLVCPVVTLIECLA